MTHIVAIGGGEIGRLGFPVETTIIDKQIIALTNKPHPKVLFLPTASGDSPDYYKSFTKHYGERLGCVTSVLNLYEKHSRSETEAAISNADIIYVGGGNTLKMMMLWRKCGVDTLLVKAHDTGTIVCGLSAGAICWFNTGLSDSRSFTSKGRTWNYINVRGLNFENIMLCPHFDAEPERRPALKNALQNTSKVAIALDNCAALEIMDNEFRILRSKPTAKAYRVYWKEGNYIEEELVPSEGYAHLSAILN